MLADLGEPSMSFSFTGSAEAKRSVTPGHFNLKLCVFLKMDRALIKVEIEGAIWICFVLKRRHVTSDGVHGATNFLLDGLVVGVYVVILELLVLED